MNFICTRFYCLNFDHYDEFINLIYRFYFYGLFFSIIEGSINSKSLFLNVIYSSSTNLHILKNFKYISLI